MKTIVHKNLPYFFMNILIKGWIEKMDLKKQMFKWSNDTGCSISISR